MARSLDLIDVKKPCTVSWAGMTGGEKVRHCDQCDLDVYNLSAMTREEATALVREREGKVCARFVRRADGTVLTKHCDSARAETALALGPVDLGTVRVGPEVLRLVSRRLAETHRCVPLRLGGTDEDTTLILAMVDPEDLVAIVEVSSRSGYRVEPFPALELDVHAAIERLYLNVEEEPEPVPEPVAVEDVDRFGDDDEPTRVLSKEEVSSEIVIDGDPHPESEWIGELAAPEEPDCVVPATTSLSRDVVLAEVGRALRQAFPDRADLLLREVERMVLVDVSGGVGSCPHCSQSVAIPGETTPSLPIEPEIEEVEPVVESEADTVQSPAARRR